MIRTLELCLWVSLVSFLSPFAGTEEITYSLSPILQLLCGKFVAGISVKVLMSSTTGIGDSLNVDSDLTVACALKDWHV
ncbi:hypothetical protein BKA66DRAFT_164886 [Pyrenochaeta sp. MPI-SDFR-AT-0127]|nr:hypothetical protein BKA66DRAFT_164886 [Pyrenochaeta sp. MPI-SDFR-AT-0127]